MSDFVTSDEPYLLVEEVAERLGLPLSVLLHRVEAGDIPARRVERADGLHYALRLGDLGIELDDEGLRSAAMADAPAVADEETLTTVFEPPEPTVESAIASAFNGGPDPASSPSRSGHLDVAGRRVDEEEPPTESDPGTPIAWGDQPPDDPWRPASQWQPAETEETAPTPLWGARPREPRQPPPWLVQPEEPAEDAAAGDDEPGDDGEDEPVSAFQPVPEFHAVPEFRSFPEYLLPNDELDDAVDVAPGGPAGPAPADDDLDGDEESVVAELAVPPPAHEPVVGIVDAAASGPRGDLASMSLDARELVAGLLDRWERTLEQRIYTEQRQRFQAELVARQNMVKELQMELHTARVEHAAAQAEKDRVLAAKERELADRERDLAETRRLAADTERQMASPAAAARRRRWFWSRDD